MPFEIWFTMNIYSNLDLVVTKGDHYIQGSCQVLHAITLVTNEVIRRQVEAKARHGRGQKEAVKIFYCLDLFGSCKDSNSAASQGQTGDGQS